MIIPPDPEKDPRLFLTSSSTPSLLLPPDSEPGSDIADPNNHSYGYPFGDNETIRRPYIGENEILPPYERQAHAEMRERERSPGHTGVTIPSRTPFDGFADSEGSTTPTASTFASGSTSRLPIPAEIPSAAATLPPGSSTANLWEGSAGGTPRRSLAARWKGKSRASAVLPVQAERDPSEPKRRQRWRKWRRWLWAAGLIGLIGIGLMIGLLSGYRGRFTEQMPTVQSGPAWHDVEPGDSRWNMAWVSENRINIGNFANGQADGSMNLTWTQGRVSSMRHLVRMSAHR
jgi:hypothetical protein